MPATTLSSLLKELRRREWEESYRSDEVDRRLAADIEAVERTQVLLRRERGRR